MGNSSSTRNNHDESVDYGAIVPQGVYTGPQDWNHSVVGQFIIDRRLAPFYRPLEEYDESWDDEQVLAARKELPPPASPDPSTPPPDPAIHPVPSVPVSRSSSRHPRPNPSKELNRVSEAALYRDAVECPICFLYFPPNINRSRCCNHPICTECFVQIKRSEPSPTHLASDPACCPYCVQEHFGVTYTPPTWRAGIGSDNNPRMRTEAVQASEQRPDNVRRKSLSADSPEVVTIDQIRPDWEAKLAAMRAVVQRRANRRIIMRQVGDRLIPVGITSGRVHPIGQDLPSGEQGEETGRSNRRRRGGNSGPGVDLSQFLGLNGQDIEELMVMEAMRLSLAEHEEAQRRQNNPSNNSSEEPTRISAANGTTGESIHATPISFVLSQRHASAAQGSGSGQSTPGTSAGLNGQPLSRTPNISSPLAQATAIALGLGLPGGSTSSAARRGSRTPSPRPPSRSIERTSDNAGSFEESTGEARPMPDDVASEHTPGRHVGEDVGASNSSGSGVGAADGVSERMTRTPSVSTSANVPASYKALPSTPEDGLASQPLIDHSSGESRLEAGQVGERTNSTA